jgi:hypothetical protein
VAGFHRYSGLFRPKYSGIALFLRVKYKKLTLIMIW